MNKIVPNIKCEVMNNVVLTHKLTQYIYVIFWWQTKVLCQKREIVWIAIKYSHPKFVIHGITTSFSKQSLFPIIVNNEILGIFMLRAISLYTLNFHQKSFYKTIKVLLLPVYSEHPLLFIQVYMVLLQCLFIEFFIAIMNIRPSITSSWHESSSR